MEQPLPLAGVRVLDLSNMLAGPMAGMHLADFGADVIKVEHPTRPDDLRAWGHSKRGVGLYWKVVNRNKRLITLDLSQPRGRQLALELAAASDVVIESFRPGTVARWGLAYQDLRRANPGVIMAHVSGYGQSGPLSHRAGFGTIADGFSGYAAITGYPDRPPLLTSFGLADASTSIFTAFAILVALRHRDRTGEGQEIDAALYEGLFTLIGSNVIDYDQLGVLQQRAGNRLLLASPRSIFQTADDQWFVVAGSSQATFERIMGCLGLAHLVDDPRFATNRRRIANAEQLEAEMGRVIATRTLDELVESFDAAGAPGGPVYDTARIFEDPHYAARQNIATVADGELGEVRMQSVTPRLSRSPGTIRSTGSRHGAHNAEVYGQLLGLDRDEIAKLEQAKVI